MSQLRAVTLLAAAALLFAGCSNAGMFPNVAGTPAQSLASFASEGSGISIEPGDNALTVLAKASCKKPSGGLICLKPGGKGYLHATLTCTQKGKKISCGSVTWKTVTSNLGLTGLFSPNPGNPSKETVTASATIKPGTYSQTISYACTAFSTCRGSSRATIVVLKIKKKKKPDSSS